MLDQIRTELSAYNAELVAVSKTKPNALIKDLYAIGQRIFGENRVPELVRKAEELPDDIEWHMIGHLQRNKVKHIAPFVSMIHSIDSTRLLNEVNKQALRYNRSIKVLLQVKVGAESAKTGIERDDIDAMIQEVQSSSLEGVEICGVMGMASFVSDADQVRVEFDALKATFDHLKATYFIDDPAFREISMGMSGDYLIALEAGSTMVRIGSLLFGKRS